MRCGGFHSNSSVSSGLSAIKPLDPGRVIDIFPGSALVDRSGDFVEDGTRRPKNNLGSAAR